MEEKRYGRHIMLLEDGELISRTCGVCWEMKEREHFFASKTKYGITSRCKDCDKAKTKQYLKGNEKHQQRNTQWKRDNVEKQRMYVSKWQQENPLLVSIKGARRRARTKDLPQTFTKEDAEQLVSRFGGCFLTGSLNYQLDHVIPIASGFGGTFKGNMLPLRSDLNQSKGQKNIFEWFKEIQERENLSQERFDEGIKYIASLNGMTNEEYENYVYENLKEE